MFEFTYMSGLGSLLLMGIYLESYQDLGRLGKVIYFGAILVWPIALPLIALSIAIRGGISDEA